MTARAILPLEYEEEGANRRRFVVAAAIVLTAHAGITVSYLLRPWPQPQGAALAPAVIVDLAPLPAAPAAVSDAAPGPQMVAQPRAAAVAPPPEPQMAQPLPDDEAPAEVTFSLPKPRPNLEPRESPGESKPQVHDGEPLRGRGHPPAPRTTAAPRFEQRTAPAPRAASPGVSASRAAAANWRDLVVARLQQSKRYPNGAASRREEGVVTLSFSVNRGGRVLSRRIARSSGYRDLDQEALAMIERAQPLPPFPPAMTQSVVHLRVPIRFSLR
jgi:protein TonB